MMRRVMTLAALAFCVAGAQAQSDDATFVTRTITPETALKAAQAALQSCRDGNYQVAVAVSDRAGVPIVLLRDRFAGTHTPESATRKAYTAAAFNMDTRAFAKATEVGQPTDGIRDISQVLAVGGGVPIQAAGSLVGAIGISGAPNGDADHGCAQAGVDAVEFDLEL